MAVAIKVGVDTGLACGYLTYSALHMDCVTGIGWTFQPPADSNIRAIVVAELCRHTIDSRPTWKLRAVGQGRADGPTAWPAPTKSTSSDDRLSARHTHP